MRRPFRCTTVRREISVISALLGAAHLAGAAVIHVDLSAAPLTIPPGLDGLYLNFVTNATSTAAVPPAGYDFNPYNNGSGLAFFSPDFPNGQGMLVSGSTALSLIGGAPISNASVYQPGQAAGTNFQITGTGFAGLRFYNESTSQLNYGWVRLQTTATTGFPTSILGYAYENTGAPISAGAIPEPAAVGLVGLSGLALIARRRPARTGPV